MKRLCLLGATGSIGRSTLDVVARHPDRYRVEALSAYSRLDELLTLCERFKPAVAVIGDTARLDELAAGLRVRGLSTTPAAGEAALCAIAALPEVDAVMAAIVGAAGLRPTLAAALAGKQVLLANKESLVMAGQFLMDAVASAGATLLPVDSEHNAIFQCLAGNAHGGAVRRLILTASGGPFRTQSAEFMETVSPEQACAHPNWVMGRKISVDSATLMNKGLEVIEARWLFGMPGSQIDVVVHPQSVIHSMVEYMDGSVLAQLGTPDMRTPIAHVLAWPERTSSGSAPLDFLSMSALTFEAPDIARFPCLRLAYAAMAAGTSAAVVLNAANEVAVEAFLARQLRFPGIAALVESVLEGAPQHLCGGLDDLLAVDVDARRRAQAWLLAHRS